jgi:predicted small lipoprotein YifL
MMNRINFLGHFASLLAVLFLLSACGEEKYTGPESFGPDEVNPAMNEAFADASGEVKKMVQDALLAYSKEDFIKSSSIIQALCSRSDLTDTERQTASRCLMTVNDELQRAASEKGDKRAEQLLRQRMMTK